MKKKYICPEVKRTSFASVDIISLSVAGVGVNVGNIKNRIDISKLKS